MIREFTTRGKADNPARPNTRHNEPSRSIPIYAEPDILIVGGGPAGTAAAIAAGRLGANVLLLERYNYLGGLSTGGLVIWIDRMTDWDGNRIISGIAKDIFDRLPKDAVMGPSQKYWGSKDEVTANYWRRRAAAYKGIVTFSPTIDPEELKTLSLRMVLEQKVRIVFHSLAVDAIVEEDKLTGVVFESKEGRQAIKAKIIIDTTGDADLLARAGLSFESDIDESDIHHRINTAFLFGGVDMEQWLNFRNNQMEQFSALVSEAKNELEIFELPECSWRNDIALFLGPRLSGYNGLNIDDLSQVDIRSRQLAISNLEFYKKNAPGFKDAFLMLVAPQTGVRHTRRLKGISKIVRNQWENIESNFDEICVSPSVSPNFPSLSIPYGVLIPRDIKGTIGAGRHISCDSSSHTFLREIPQCWATGQAAGIAAALAVNESLEPRNIPITLLQRELLKQGAYLSPSVIKNCQSNP